MDDQDWSSHRFARMLAHLEPRLPISDAYEEAHLPGNHWWSSQREHLVGWFSELEGPGAFGRKTRGLTAKHGYNHFQCAPGLLWLAEALGERPEIVQEAAAAAGLMGRPASQCKKIRQIIPWERIVTLIGLRQLDCPGR